MESTTFFNTKSGNDYLYDNNNSMFLLINPIIKYFYQLEKRKINIEDKIADLNNQNTITGIGTISKSEIRYYFNKYKFLKKNNFFSKIKTKQRVLPDLNSDNLRYVAANIKQILFEVTETCNLNCTYCAYNEMYKESDNRINTSLSIDSAKYIFDFFLKLWNSRLNVSEYQNVIFSFYGGEPLLNFNFISDLIDYISKKKSIKKKISYSITTNGVLLKRYIGYLVQHDFLVTVSLDGNFSNNQYRIDHNNNNPHKQIVNDLKEIMRDYSVFYRNNISFNTVLHDKNSVESVYNFFNKVLNKSTKIMEVNTDGVKSERKEDITKIHSSFSESYFKAESKAKLAIDDNWDLQTDNQMLTLLRGHWSNYVRNYNDLFSKKTEQKKFITGTCMPFWKKMFITSKGFILPCERIDYKYSLGKIINNEVQINFDEIAKQYNNYYHNIYSQCNSCYISRSCLQCMFFIKNIETNPICKEFCNKNEFAQYLSSIYSMMEDDPSKLFNLLDKTIYE